MPLTFDLPLDALHSYPGRNPRPHDFDAYWQAGLEELERLDPAVAIEPAAFATPAADCFHLYFTGVGGARIHAKLLQPKPLSSRGPAVLMFHGYSMNAGGWLDKVGYAASGFTVAALDCRGQGGRSDDPGGTRGWTLRGQIVRGLEDASPRKMLFRGIFLDTVQLARIVMELEHVDPERIGATGGSQGGALTVACGALEPRVARLAPVFPFLADYQRVWEMDLAAQAYGELREWFRRFDPLHQRRDEVFTRLGYIDVQHLAPRIQGEVVMSVGLMDQICPPSTQFAIYNKIAASKSLRLYPDFGHESLPGNDDLIYAFMRGL